MFTTIQSIVMSVIGNDRDISIIDKRDNCIDILDAALANKAISIEQWSTLMDAIHDIAGEM